MKLMRDRTNVSAIVILKDGKYLGKVLTHYSKSGVVSVEVYDNYKLVHKGKAGGHGYDKFASAISGAIIDGHKITDHCEEQLEPPTKEGFPKDFKPPLGYWLANFSSDTMTYSHCYKIPRLDYLHELGYTLIYVI